MRQPAAIIEFVAKQFDAAEAAYGNLLVQYQGLPLELSLCSFQKSVGAIDNQVCF